jgi:exosortase/archaeosortase family protein
MPRRVGTPAVTSAGGKQVARFAVVFGLLFALFHVSTLTPFVRDRVFPASLRLNSELAAALLRTLGEGATAVGTTIRSPRFALTMGRGCDALDATALFIAAVLASPVSLGARALGALVGPVLLLALNQVRTVSLFYVGLYFPATFNTMHSDVWQAVFIVLALFLWVLWATWAVRNTAR